MEDTHLPRTVIRKKIALLLEAFQATRDLEDHLESLEKIDGQYYAGGKLPMSGRLASFYPRKDTAGLLRQGMTGNMHAKSNS